MMKSSSKVGALHPNDMSNKIDTTEEPHELTTFISDDNDGSSKVREMLMLDDQGKCNDWMNQEMNWRRTAVVFVVVLVGVFMFLLPDEIEWSGMSKMGKMSLVSSKTEEEVWLDQTFGTTDSMQERIEKLTEEEVAQIEKQEEAEADALPIGPGGAQVMFLPCKVDGFWSNMRQVVAAIYMARHYNLTYVSQDIYYKFQDTGRIQGVDGPITVFDLFDEEYMSKFLRVERREAFFEYQKPRESSARQSMTMIGVDKGIRCEIKMNKANVDKNFNRWLRYYGLSKYEFTKNRYRTRAQQKEMLVELSWLPPDRKFVMAGTPRFGNIRKDYIYTPLYQYRHQVPEFWTSSFETIQFAKPIIALQQKAKQMFGIGENDKYIAVHIRRGNTYALGGKSGQATTDDVSAAVHRAVECIGEEPKHIFISTVRPYLQREQEKLQKEFPDINVVYIGQGNVTWEALQPGLGARNATITRAGVEMQFWTEADAFIGSRSTMSSFVHLIRLAHRDGDACNRFSQKAWAEQATGKFVP